MINLPGCMEEKVLRKQTNVTHLIFQHVHTTPPPVTGLLAVELFAIIKKRVIYAGKSDSLTVIFTDNKSVLSLISNTSPKFFKQIVHTVQRNLILFPKGKIKLNCVPAHRGNMGNGF